MVEIVVVEAVVVDVVEVGIPVVGLHVMNILLKANGVMVRLLALVELLVPVVAFVMVRAIIVEAVRMARI
ncbi:hypothetical protein ACIQCM_01870 [Pseudarthrobacter sp. NPDC092439]|uniref:hypothetical protein n=1 Tax=unclassified Pseudarthrobacter TaxID=2647000 RepID=UPI0038224A67